jgi:hypothetical protein
MRLHLYKVMGGYVVEDDQYRLLANVGGMWGFAESSDVAFVFGSADAAFAMARRWDPSASQILG